MSDGTDNFFSQNFKKLDLAYIWAEPLMESHKTKGLVAIDNPLDFEKEFMCIYNILKRMEKEILIRKDAGNFDTLSQVLNKQPKIIHISCHGDYDSSNDQFFLALEEKNTGI